MENQNPVSKPIKGRRLTKKQAVVLLALAFLIWFISVSFIGSTLLNAAATITFIFSLASLFTKNGLRWK